MWELKRQGIVGVICNTCTTGNTGLVTCVVGEEVRGCDAKCSGLSSESRVYTTRVIGGETGMSVDILQALLYSI